MSGHWGQVGDTVSSITQHVHEKWDHKVMLTQVHREDQYWKPLLEKNINLRKKMATLMRHQKHKQ